MLLLLLLLLQKGYKTSSEAGVGAGQLWPKNALSNRKTQREKEREKAWSTPSPVRQKNVYHKVIEVYHCWPHQHTKKSKSYSVRGTKKYKKKNKEKEKKKNQRPQRSLKWKSSRSPN